MKLGIMQPYFFPYIGYFQLMKNVDQWVVFDDIQYIDKGWINRNRILHPNIEKQWQYITLPLDKRKQFDKICNIQIKSEINWQAEILGKLTAYKRKAPFYSQTINLINECFETTDLNLSSFLVRCLKITANYIGIETPIKVQSLMNLDLGVIEHPGQWALKIAEKLKAKEYINPFGGRDIFKKEEFDKKNIKLSFSAENTFQYSQRRENFVSNLSIIDTLFWNDKNMIHDFLLNNSNKL